MEQYAEQKLQELCHKVQSLYLEDAGYLDKQISKLSKDKQQDLEPRVKELNSLLQSCQLKESNSLYKSLKDLKSVDQQQNMKTTLSKLNLLIFKRTSVSNLQTQDQDKNEAITKERLLLSSTSTAPRISFISLDKEEPLRNNGENFSQRSTGVQLSCKSSNDDCSSKNSKDSAQNSAKRQGEDKRFSNIFKFSGGVLNKLVEVVTPKSAQNKANLRNFSDFETLNNQILSLKKDKHSAKTFTSNQNQEDEDTQSHDEEKVDDDEEEKVDANGLKLKLKQQQKSINKAKRQRQTYATDYGIKTAKVDFFFNQSPNLAELDYYMEYLPQFTQFPENTNQTKELCIVKRFGKTYIYILGEFHNKLKQAYFKALEEKTIAEVDHILKIGKLELPLCVKIQYVKQTGEVISKLKKIKDMKKHIQQKQIKTEFQLKKKDSKLSHSSNKINLNIRAVFRGAQIQCDTEVKWTDKEGNLIKEFEIIRKLTEIRIKNKESQKDEIEWVNINKVQFIIGQQSNQLPFMLHSDQLNKVEFNKIGSNKIYFDFLKTFKFRNKTQHKLFYLQQLERNSFEFKYVTYKWGAMFIGPDNFTSTIRNTIKKMASEGLPTSFSDRIITIQKIGNTDLLGSFEEEFISTHLSQGTKNAEDILKHVFYGPGIIDPQKIFEHGLSYIIKKFKKGIYLSENSHKAHEKAYKLGELKQVLLCLAIAFPLKLTTDKIKEDGQYLTPRNNLNNSETIYDKEKGKFIYYDGNKLYPGYLITYK